MCSSQSVMRTIDSHWVWWAAGSCSNCSAMVLFNCFLIYLYDKSFSVNQDDFDLELVCTLTRTYTGRGSIGVYSSSDGLRSLRSCVSESFRRAALPSHRLVALSWDSVASQHARPACRWRTATLLPGADTVSSCWMDHCRSRHDQRQMSFLQCMFHSILFWLHK